MQLHMDEKICLKISRKKKYYLKYSASFPGINSFQNENSAWYFFLCFGSGRRLVEKCFSVVYLQCFFVQRDKLFRGMFLWSSAIRFRSAFCISSHIRDIKSHVTKTLLPTNFFDIIRTTDYCVTQNRRTKSITPPGISNKMLNDILSYNLLDHLHLQNFYSLSPHAVAYTIEFHVEGRLGG